MRASRHPRTFRHPVVEILEARRLFVAPVAADDFYAVDEGTTLTVPPMQGVLANDVDPDGGGPMAAILVGGPMHGTLQLNPNGSFAYTPAPGFFGLDGFAYAAGDGGPPGVPAQVSITVHRVPRPGALGFSVADVSVDERDGSAVLTVVRTGGADGTVSVDYALTAGGTATSEEDFFTDVSGTLVFGDGQFDADLFVFVVEDDLVEPSETLEFVLSDPTAGATLAPGAATSATVTILSAPLRPTVNIDDAPRVTEGGAGETTNAVFPVTLSASSDRPVTIDYETSFGTATAAEDYEEVFDSVTIPPGETTVGIPVRVFGDAANERDESVSVLLLFAGDAIVTDSFGVGLIDNDDNLAPAAADHTVTRAPGSGPVTVELGALLGNPDGDPLTVALTALPGRGFATYDDGGTPLDASDDRFTYAPATLGLDGGDDAFSYTVTDPFEGTATGTITIQSRGAASLPNPLDPTKTDLLLAASPAADAVRLQRTRNGREVRVTVNGEDQGVFAPTGRVVIAGGAGDDVIDARKMAVGVELLGGGGNDVLRGGRGADVVLGGDGDDTLCGGDRRDVLIGGPGADRIGGGGDDDILIAGAVAFGGDAPAHRQFRNDLIAAWTAPGSRAARLLAILDGTGEPPIALGTDNVIDDAATDVLSGNGGSDWFLATAESAPTRDRFNAEFGKDDFTEI